MKILFRIICALLLPVYAVAQNSFTIQGIVADSASQQPLESVTLVLKNTADQKITAGAITDAAGSFKLERVSKGKYELSISSVGYNNLVIPLTVNADTSLGTISFASGAKSLDAAVITAQKPLITKTAEKTVYNVSQSPTNQTGTAEDVLRNMPGVIVDQNGGVTITGKQGVKVLVDGRPNALAQSNLPVFLKSIPANAIESIELITNPSARYSAEGNAGIINIKLKKGKADGLNGNVGIGYGILDRYLGSFVLNYRKNKINLFANYSLFAAKVKTEYNEDRAITIDTPTFYKMRSTDTEHRLNNDFKLGFDYFANDKTSLTYTLGGNINKNRSSTPARSENMNGDSVLLYLYESDRFDKGFNLSITNSLSFQKKFDSTDHELNIDVIHTYLKGRNDSRLNSLAYDSGGIYSELNSLLRHTDSRNNINNVVVQLDYNRPLKWKGHKISTGLQNNTTLNGNVFDAYYTLNNQEQKDSLLSNHFNYTENIAALYIAYDGMIKKEWFSWSAGLRGEHTYIKSNTSSVNRRYFSLFPSASITFSLPKDNTISTSYSRRIDRPSFRSLNNSISYIDQYSTWQGNPLLQPMFSHLISANYSKTIKQHMFSFDASGNFQNGNLTESSRVDSNRITRGGLINGGLSRSFNLSFYTRLQLTKWWTVQMNHSYNYTYYGYKPGVNRQAISGHLYNLWGWMQFKFWKNTFIEISGWYNSGGVNPQGKSYSSGNLTASIKKSFLKDHLTVSVSCYNVLNTMKWRWGVENTNLSTYGTWQLYNQVVFINLNYRFGKQKVAQRTTKQNERLGGGDGGGGR